ncbi:MAG: hypothetical protein QF577_05125 [Phycisphaerae bacterium]|nr:hypothetical protein [Phycisphaerae bacterium]MDP7636913.1 hypothetical protein [Phycisphaerae bacterium]
MKAVHKPRHAAAVLILLGVAGAYGFLGRYDRHLGGDQVRLATVAVKDHNPTLYGYDPVYGPAGPWRGHSPLFQAMLKLAMVPTGYQDLSLPFRAMVPVMVLVHLLGMYALVYRQCRSWSVSVFIAVLSSTVTVTLGGWVWGAGTPAMVTPAGLCQSLWPVVVLGFLAAVDAGTGRRGSKFDPHRARVGLGRWKLPAVFACIGLLGNVNLPAAMNMVLVLVAVYLVGRRFSPRAWPMAIGCVLVAAAAAAPQAGYLIVLRYSPGQGGYASLATVFKALGEAKLPVLFPMVAGALMDWLLVCAVLIIVAGAVLIRLERFHSPNVGLWLGMLATAVVISVGLTGLAQLVAMLLGRGPVVVDFVQAAPLAMLPLYVLAAQTLTNLFRLSRRGRMPRWACAALMVVWMVPAENLRVARHQVYEWGTAFMAAEDKPVRMQKRGERIRRGAELRRMAQWARHNTPVDAVFIVDSDEFRMWSRRSIVAGHDVRWVLYLAPWRLERWMARSERQRRMLRPPVGKADTEALRRFTGDLASEPPWKNVKHWYVVLRGEVAPEESAWLEYMRPQGWGKHFVLGRVK